jgi:hypothetical protein
VNGTGMKNNQMRCYQCVKPGHYSKSCPEKRQNNMGRQSKLFVGLIEHSEYAKPYRTSQTLDTRIRQQHTISRNHGQRRLVEDVKFNDDVMVDPTDNLNDINSFIFN